MQIPAAITIPGKWGGGFQEYFERAEELNVLNQMGVNFAHATSQLRQAVRCASKGDRNAAQAHIDSASAFLQQAVERAQPGAETDVRKRRVSRGALSPWRLRRVQAFVEDNLSTKLRVDQLADLIGLSPSHFMRVFRSRLGVTVRSYIESRRIEAAKELMLRTSARLTDIALQCGMTDQPHFTRVFRRNVGQPPHRWRESQFDSTVVSNRD